MGVTYTVFFLTAAYEPHAALPLIGLVEAVLLYLVFQGAAWARSGLLLVFGISAAELLFSSYESLAPNENPSAFAVGRALADAVSCVILLGKNVTAFMRHQRHAQLMSALASSEPDEPDEPDTRDQDDVDDEGEPGGGAPS